MSTTNALRFIQLAGVEGPLRQRLQTAAGELTLEDLADLGAQVGLPFSVDDLRAAFAQDWAMRRVFYTATIVE